MEKEYTLKIRYKKTVDLYPEFFNDVYGPIMQPGSSSHMAGPCRLGFLANCLLGESPKKIGIVLGSDGSLAGTFGSMNEGGAVLAGAMGFLPDDEGVIQIKKIVKKEGVKYDFDFAEMKESPHINAMKFILTGKSGKNVSLVGDSIGGGMIETRLVDGFPLKLKGDTYVVLVWDPSCTLLPKKLVAIQESQIGLVEAGTSLTREKGALHYFKIAKEPDRFAIEHILPDYKIEILKPVLPVISKPNKKPQLFDSMTKWREIAGHEGIALWEVAVRYEMDASGWDRTQIIDYMKKIEKLMYRHSHAAYEEEHPPLKNPFARSYTEMWAKHIISGTRLLGPAMTAAIKWALGAVRPIPGVIWIPGPMGAGGGLIYAVLCAAIKDLKIKHDELLKGLFIAAGVGAIAYTRTRPTGEMIGCTGECGICGAMAAAGLTEMLGGSSQQVENAASLSLQSSIGIPCDPIPGGYGQPCFSRVVTAVCMAMVFAELALAGKEAILPLHEVIDAANDVGRMLPPELRCTSMGGHCSTPTGLRQKRAFAKWFSTRQF